jgi:hypothetical protein
LTGKEACDYLKRFEVEFFGSHRLDEISEWFMINVTERKMYINIYKSDYDITM